MTVIMPKLFVNKKKRKINVLTDAPGRSLKNMITLDRTATRYEGSSFVTYKMLLCLVW